MDKNKKQDYLVKTLIFQFIFCTLIFFKKCNNIVILTFKHLYIMFNIFFSIKSDLLTFASFGNDCGINWLYLGN